MLPVLIFFIMLILILSYVLLNGNYSVCTGGIDGTISRDRAIEFMLADPIILLVVEKANKNKIGINTITDMVRYYYNNVNKDIAVDINQDIVEIYMDIIEDNDRQVVDYDRVYSEFDIYDNSMNMYKINYYQTLKQLKYINQQTEYPMFDKNFDLVIANNYKLEEELDRKKPDLSTAMKILTDSGIPGYLYVYDANYEKDMYRPFINSSARSSLMSTLENQRIANNYKQLTDSRRLRYVYKIRNVKLTINIDSSGWYINRELHGRFASNSDLHNTHYHTSPDQLLLAYLANAIKDIGYIIEIATFNAQNTTNKAVFVTKDKSAALAATIMKVPTMVYVDKIYFKIYDSRANDIWTINMFLDTDTDTYIQDSDADKLDKLMVYPKILYEYITKLKSETVS